MKICPNCGRVVSYNSYFGAYICTTCNWEDSTIGQRRNKGTGVFHGWLAKDGKKNLQNTSFEKKLMAAK